MKMYMAGIVHPTATKMPNLMHKPTTPLQQQFTASHVWVCHRSSHFCTQTSSGFSMILDVAAATYAHAIVVTPAAWEQMRSASQQALTRCLPQPSAMLQHTPFFDVL